MQLPESNSKSDSLPESPDEPGPLEGLVEAGDLLVLVTPIDGAAPRGGLILPEMKTLRDALDRGCAALVLRDGELAAMWPALARRPRLVVTDSQVFDSVLRVLPPDQALTSFSLLFARQKFGLGPFAAGLSFLEALRGGEASGLPPLRVHVIMACSGNRSHELVATERIPRVLAAGTGRRVSVSLHRGLSDRAPDEACDLAVLCGSCKAAAEVARSQIAALAASGIPALNFGALLAWESGSSARALSPLLAASPGPDRISVAGP